VTGGRRNCYSIVNFGRSDGAPSRLHAALSCESIAEPGFVPDPRHGFPDGNRLFRGGTPLDARDCGKFAAKYAIFLFLPDTSERKFKSCAGAHLAIPS
jgi:hypothetical protein